MRVVQYIAYFPPHVWGLESHAAQRAKRWVAQWCGSCLVATYSVGQTAQTLAYERDGYHVVVIPAFEIIPTFPFPKFWTRKYWQAHRRIKQFAPEILITRTRFFLPSFFGGLLAKWWGVKRVHIEHGVDYVKLNAPWKNVLAWLYDQIIWRFIFRAADQVIGISEWCKRFIKRFTNRAVVVIYRGVDFVPASPTRDILPDIYQLGFVGRLAKLKGVDTLLSAFHKLYHGGQRNIHLTLVGDGEEKETLTAHINKLWLQQQVTLLGMRDQSYLAHTFYPSMHIIINASLQEGLPTSVLEWLLAQCVVVATNVWGTPEISSQDDLILVAAGETSSLQKGILQAIHNWQGLHGRSEKWVKERFAWEKNIVQYQEAFEKLSK